MQRSMARNWGLCARSRARTRIYAQRISCRCLPVHIRGFRLRTGYRWAPPGRSCLRNGSSSRCLRLFHLQLCTHKRLRLRLQFFLGLRKRLSTHVCRRNFTRSRCRRQRSGQQTALEQAILYQPRTCESAGTEEAKTKRRHYA